jgi:PAS domain-containing protein
MDIDVVPILNSAGKCTHFAAIERDITESKRLKESLKLFRTLMDRSPDAIEVVDPETGRFLDVNETACRRLGYSREEMLTLSIPDVLETGDVPFSLQAAWRRCEEPESGPLKPDTAEKTVPLFRLRSTRNTWNWTRPICSRWSATSRIAAKWSRR